MVYTNYYGDKPGDTFLEIYSLLQETDEKVVHRQLQDQEAYDTWHLSYYFKEILEYDRIGEQDEITFDQLPRKEKNLFLHMLLGLRPDYDRVVELGSSLFEMIDGLQAMNQWIENGNRGLPTFDTQRIDYTGIEISELLALGSKRLHPDHDIEIVPDAASFEGTGDLLYDRSVTNYAFEDAEEVATFVNRFEAAYLNFFVSYEETFASARLGKTIVYFSLENVLEHLEKPLFHLFGSRAPSPHSGQDLSRGRPVLEAFFLCCEESYVQEMMDLAAKNAQIQGWFDRKDVSPVPAERFLEDEGIRP